MSEPRLPMFPRRLTVATHAFNRPSYSAVSTASSYARTFQQNGRSKQRRFVHQTDVEKVAELAARDFGLTYTLFIDNPSPCQRYNENVSFGSNGGGATWRRRSQRHFFACWRLFDRRSLPSSAHQPLSQTYSLCSGTSLARCRLTTSMSKRS